MTTLTDIATVATANRFDRLFSAGKKHFTGLADIAAIVMPAVFIVGTAALESAQIGYSPLTDTVSMLVWGSNGWLENLLFCLNALFLTIFAGRLYRASRNPAGRAGVAMLLLAGISFLVIAICPTLGPGEVPCLRSQIHEYTARGISAIFPIACLLLSLGWRKVVAFKNISNCTLAFGAVGLALNIVGLEYVTGNLEWIGALERLIILNGFAWLATLGLYFCHMTREEHYNYKSRVFISSLSYGVRMELRDFFGRLLPGAGARMPVYSEACHRPYDDRHVVGTGNMHISSIGPDKRFLRQMLFPGLVGYMACDNKD